MGLHETLLANLDGVLEHLDGWTARFIVPNCEVELLCITLVENIGQKL